MKKVTIMMLFFSGVVFAAMGPNMQSFSDFDTNHDGSITKNEFETTQQQHMKQRAEAGYPMRNVGNAPTFSDMDQNKDGVVNQVEFKNFQQKRMMNRPGPMRGKAQ
ncbi:EF-hand domain-containing protein [Sulfurospirillum sp. 1612]|uniref:EF-hand domain-containing protein n=1 Tax=Sulfurospirillum sp. 1612 TaxID=3094835 RepID=UPI002F925EF3